MVPSKPPTASLSNLDLLGLFTLGHSHKGKLFFKLFSLLTTDASLQEHVLTYTVLRSPFSIFLTVHLHRLCFVHSQGKTAICLPIYITNTMAPRNGNNTTRSQNKGRGRKKEPQYTAPNAQNTPSPAPQVQSPPHEDTLPLDNQNKPSQETVSTNALLSAVTKTPEHKSLISQHDTISTNKEIQTLNDDLSGLPVQNPNPTVGAPAGVSDNTAPPSQAATSGHPLKSLHPDSTDPFTSDPDDPWHSTFLELQSIRSRMLTLEKLDANTRTLSQTIQDTNDKASRMDTQIRKNSQQLQAVSDKTSMVKKDTDSNTQLIKG